MLAPSGLPSGEAVDEEKCYTLLREYIALIKKHTGHGTIMIGIAGGLITLVEPTIKHRISETGKPLTSAKPVR